MRRLCLHRLAENQRNLRKVGRRPEQQQRIAYTVQLDKTIGSHMVDMVAVDGTVRDFLPSSWADGLSGGGLANIADPASPKDHRTLHTLPM